MKIVAVIQARMGSTRLPGKVLREIAGRPMLVHVLERVLACELPDQVVVATTNNAEDLPVVEVSKRLGASVFTGSQDDVLDRYFQAARAYSAEVVMRLTADCPLLDPAEVDRVIRHLVTHPELDYVGTGQTYPEGYGAEAFTQRALKRAWEEAVLASEREHVTPYIWKHSTDFRVERLELPEDLSKFRVTVDEEIDLQVVATLVEVLATSEPLFGIDAVVSFLKRHPDVASRNSYIRRQAGYLKSVSEDRIVSETEK
jgi:spore coat polysaccharide biosynthesis protein SpsF